MIVRIYVLLMLTCALAGFASPQFVQQGGKLVAAGAVNWEDGAVGQGFSVALSADGNTAIVGSGSGLGQAGGAWVWTRSAGVWTQQGGRLVGAGALGAGAAQGFSVALSADGNTAIVGGPWDNPYVTSSYFYASVGAAWVWTRSAGVWTQQGSKLVDAGGRGAQQGYSVALSGDGSTAIVGGPGANAAWVYTRSAGVWTQQGELAGTDANPYAGQGASVALSADGNTVIAGGYTNNSNNAVAAWVFTRSGGVWTQQGSMPVRSGAAALSADGNTAIVGGNAGASVYTRSGSVWTQQGSKPVGTGAVALSADGNTAIVGDDGLSGGYLYGVGGAWVWTRSAGVWTQQGGKLVGAGAVGSKVLEGSSVALSGDGSTAIVGGPDDNCDAGGVCPGAAWVFVSSATPSGSPVVSGGVVNGASFLPGIAPATWITIKGTNLSATTRTWNSSDFSGSKLPTQLDGVSVAVNGKLAYVYFISPTQLNVLSPADATQGSVPVQVTTALGVSNVVSADESALSPALFTFSPQGGKYVAAVRADGAYVAPPNLISGMATVPAKPGDTVLLFGTGFGPTTPPSPTGQLINPAPLANPVTVRIGGAAAITQFAGIVSPGEYQFNVVVPNVSNGDNAVSIEIGGSFSQSTAFLNIQR